MLIDTLYNNYFEILRYYIYGSTIHSRLVSRYSNDAMFIGFDGVRKEYSQASKIYVLLETINGLINDNPLFVCDDIYSDANLVPLDVSDNVRKKYENYFNVLLGCLKTTLMKVDTSYRKNIKVENISCGNMPGGNEPIVKEDCIIGDYDPLDYENNASHFIKICNNNITPPVPTGKIVYIGSSTTSLIYWYVYIIWRRS